MKRTQQLAEAFMEREPNGRKYALWILGFCGVIAIFIWSSEGNPSTKLDSYTPSSDNQLYESNPYRRYEQDDISIDRYDAINDYWDEIRDYVNGSETIVACSWDSGSCYDLDADISNGYIETVYFENGGYLSIYAEIDSDGEASDFAQDDREWSFTLNMDSSIVEDAVYSWASDNGYTIE